MRRDAIAGGALIGSALMMLVTMGLHPVPGDFAAGAGHAATMTLISHSIAIASVPVAFFGALGLSRAIARESDLTTAALVTFGVACVAVMIAATASGLIAPTLMGAAEHAPGTAHETFRALSHYNFSVNQAFAIIHVVASSAAIALWSAAMLVHRFSRAAGVLGCVVGGATLLVVFSGHLTLDVHGFGAVVLGQGIWLVVVGVRMMRSQGR